MIISDLQYLEVVSEDNRIEGGLQEVSGSSSSTSGLATTGSVFVSNSSNTSATEQPNVVFVFPFSIVVGTRDQTTGSAFSSGSTSSR